MRDEDIRELIGRCRTLAGKADVFTSKRLQDLAQRYEAMYEKRPGTPKVVSLSVSPQAVTVQAVTIQPVTIQSVSIELGKDPDQQRVVD
jgi:hypothetical protein